MNAQATTVQVFAIGLLSVGLCPATAACASRAMLRAGAVDGGQDVVAHAHPNLAAARELDQEGVRRFHEGHYADAIRYFRAAYRLGGPSSELWNVARSLEKIDDAEAACATIGEYLAQKDLSPQDRAEAERETRALRTRPSVLTVTTTPPGAFVTVDGAPLAAQTPVSVEIPPGRHAIAVRRDGYGSDTRSLEAHFGRAIIVSLDLAPGRK